MRKVFFNCSFFILASIILLMACKKEKYERNSKPEPEDTAIIIPTKQELLNATATLSWQYSTKGVWLGEGWWHGAAMTNYHTNKPIDANIDVTYKIVYIASPPLGNDTFYYTARFLKDSFKAHYDRSEQKEIFRYEFITGKMPESIWQGRVLYRMDTDSVTCDNPLYDFLGVGSAYPVRKIKYVKKLF